MFSFPVPVEITKDENCGIYPSLANGDLSDRRGQAHDPHGPGIDAPAWRESQAADQPSRFNGWSHRQPLSTGEFTGDGAPAFPDRNGAVVAFDWSSEGGSVGI